MHLWAPGEKGEPKSAVLLNLFAFALRRTGVPFSYIKGSYLDRQIYHVKYQNSTRAIRVWASMKLEKSWVDCSKDLNSGFGIR
jgi:hypothetical protein